jgi:hypothetical protein
MVRLIPSVSRCIAMVLVWDRLTWITLRRLPHFGCA